MKLRQFKWLLLLLVCLAALARISGCTPQKKQFEGIRIIFFVGGNSNDSFSPIVFNGAKAAARDLGPEVEYVWSNWDRDKMVAQFMDAVARKPDAIAMMGHPGHEALAPHIHEAVRKGIIVTTQNVDLPQLEEQYAPKGFGYVGTNNFNHGLGLARRAIRKFSLKDGDKALVFGVLEYPVRGERTRGAIEGLKESKLAVDYREVSLEMRQNPMKLVLPMLKDHLQKNPDLKFILVDDGIIKDLVPILRDLGLPPGQIKVAGIDLMKENLEGVKSGYIGLLIDQQPFLQGYLPILQACLTKKYGMSGLHIETSSSYVDESNIDFVLKLVEQGVR